MLSPLPFGAVASAQEPGPTTSPAPSHQPAVTETPSQSDEPTIPATRANETQGRQPEIDQETQAIALLFQHEDWTFAQIADQIDVNRKTLYKWEKFREAAELSGRLKPRGPKGATPRRGHKSKDRVIEAYQDECEDE